MAERILTYPKTSQSAIAVWDDLCRQARDFTHSEPDIAGFLHKAILAHADFGASWIALLARALGNEDINTQALSEIFAKIIMPEMENAASRDLEATQQRDPACNDVLQAFLYFKGFKALSAHRFAHALWRQGRVMLALFVQSRISDLWAVDIHPAAQIGCGVMIDHASAVVIGETAIVEDDVSLLHGVTLGGRGMEPGDRHPKVRRGAFIGAGASILGNIEIGEQTIIAAGSVVLKDIPAHSTAAGMPARIIRK